MNEFIEQNNIIYLPTPKKPESDIKKEKEGKTVFEFDEDLPKEIIDSIVLTKY